jgi:hypothetical protein
VLAIHLQPKIEGVYTQQQCAHCLSRAMEPGNANQLFEFGVCDEHYFTEMQAIVGKRHVPNIMTSSRWWDASVTRSNVSAYIWTAVFVVAAVASISIMIVLLGFKVARRREQDNRLFLVLTVFLNFFTVVLLVFLANTLFSLYRLDDGCYVSAVPKSFLVANGILIYLYFIPFLFACCFAPDSNRRCWLHCFQLLALSAYLVFSLIMSIVVAHKGGEPGAVIVVSLAIMAVFEAPLALFGFELKALVARTESAQHAAARDFLNNAHHHNHGDGNLGNFEDAAAADDDDDGDDDGNDDVEVGGIHRALSDDADAVTPASDLFAEDVVLDDDDDDDLDAI